MIGARSSAGRPGAPADERAAAVVLLIDPARVRETPPERLARLHGLNEREAAVPARLGEGAEVAQIADALGIARETVRRHLQRIRAGPGTRRQDELVAPARRPPP